MGDLRLQQARYRPVWVHGTGWRLGNNGLRSWGDTFMGHTVAPNLAETRALHLALRQRKQIKERICSLLPGRTLIVVFQEELGDRSRNRGMLEGTPARLVRLFHHRPFGTQANMAGTRTPSRRIGTLFPFPCHLVRRQNHRACPQAFPSSKRRLFQTVQSWRHECAYWLLISLSPNKGRAPGGLTTSPSPREHCL